MKPEEQGFIDPQDPRYVTYQGRRMLRVIGATGEVPEPAPEATPPAPEPVAAPPEATPPNPGPWAADLEQRFPDPTARAAADAYLREVWQPRVTQLEQSQLPEGASTLWSDINDPEKAAATYLALTGELFDPELAEIVQGALTDYYADPTEVTAPEATPPAPAERDPEVQALIDKANTEEYNTVVAAEIAKNEIPEEWADLVHPMVVSASGDIPAAAAALKAKLEARGVLKVDATPAPPAPPAVGSVVPPAVPTTKNYGGDLDAAIDDFLATQHAQAPPPVGTV